MTDLEHSAIGQQCCGTQYGFPQHAEGSAWATSRLGQLSTRTAHICTPAKLIAVLCSAVCPPQAGCRVQLSPYANHSGRCCHW